jgi:hypothetical protein
MRTTTEIEIGDCFIKGEYAYRVIDLLPDGRVYVEWLHKEKRTASERDNSFSEDTKSKEYWGAEIWLTTKERHDLHESDLVKEEEYMKFRSGVLKLFNIIQPENLLFKNILAAQKVAEAEELIHMAVKLEKISNTD